MAKPPRMSGRRAARDPRGDTCQLLPMHAIIRPLCGLLLALSMIAAPPPRGGALAQGARIKITIGKILDETLSREGQQVKNAIERAYEGYEEISGACEAWSQFLGDAANAVAQEVRNGRGGKDTLTGSLQDNFGLDPAVTLFLGDRIFENLIENPEGSVVGLSDVRFRLRRICQPPSLDGDWTASSAGGGSVCTLKDAGDQQIIARYAELNNRMVNEFGYRVGDICFEGAYDGNTIEGTFNAHMPVEAREKCPRQWRNSEKLTLSLSGDEDTLDGQYDGRGIRVRSCELVPMEPTAYTLKRKE